MLVMLGRLSASNIHEHMVSLGKAPKLGQYVRMSILLSRVQELFLSSLILCKMLLCQNTTLQQSQLYHKDLIYNTSECRWQT